MTPHLKMAVVPPRLGLRAGEVAQVRSKDEILSTLDINGALDSMPFMPEMLEYCGKEYRVYKRADKTCDTISGKYESRRMVDTVHLENTRCTGEAHGGCDMTCLLFWKEAWLRRPGKPSEKPSNDHGIEPGCAEDDLRQASRKDANRSNSGEEVYSCQATELLKASSSLPWWDVRQYLREIRSGNIGAVETLRVLFIAGFNCLHVKTRGWPRYPFMDSSLLINKSSTPMETLNLQPGEYVRIKSKEEILKTLNHRYQNRGLLFDKEMVKYCGRTAKVLKRVQRLVDEKTGKMISISGDCIILEGLICCGDLSEKRLLCPRSLYSFWRETWLERVPT